ncbi:hypothetical protein [Candidatus Uabimicrobium amorphum]|uniref:Uncharacterized protein n=1 Tax=Uabimicrobium amorphum TaxID=2596890 RepID=A0A5S9IV81_UABAM|nr:hypothetical protein [Candidatus Uabimicrobium amorphum]BBM88196.1 hypothetical protein UABAM_06617 [Candidatus Uabimicrobium amorphum]
MSIQKIVCIFVLLSLHVVAQNIPEAPIEGTPVFEGKALIGVSDADQIATAYANGVLQRLPGLSDTLTTVKLPLNPNRPQMSTINVSNSVVSWPQIVDVSKDGLYAFVVETRSVPSVSKVDNVYTDLPVGSFLTVIDMRDLGFPRIVEQQPIATNPTSIMVLPSKNLLAITSEESGRELCLASFRDGRVGELSFFSIPNRQHQHFRGGVRAVAWHPSGNYLAFNISDREIAFYRVNYTDGRPTSVTLVGENITAGDYISAGSFTPNGRFYIIPDLKWGDKQTDYLFNPHGRIISIAFSESGEHHISSVKKVGYSPEGFAMSPDGSLLVTVNMNRTYLPDKFPASIWPYRKRSSLTLAKLDNNTGEIEIIDEYGFNGLLPEDAVFDASGRNLAVAIYHNREDEPREGFIEFWNVDKSGTPKLKRTGYKIPCMRGLHDLVVIPK